MAVNRLAEFKALISRWFHAKYTPA